MDSKRFIEFLEIILKDKKDHLIVLDNGGMHKTNEIRNFIKSSGNDYLYILPYHHYLNPIEEYFNQLKHYIKLDKPLEFEDIKRSIEKSINNIKINNYNNYFLHSFDIKQLIKPKKIYLKIGV